MSNNIGNELGRIHFLLNFSPKKTLFEQSDPTPWDRTPGTSDEEQRQLEKDREIELIKQSEYPNYCKYPNKAIYPKLKDISKKDSLIEGFCNYPAPSKDGGIIALYAPMNSTIFWWDEKSIISFSTKIYKEHGDYSPDFELLFAHLSKILPFGTVRGIKTRDNTYNTSLNWDQSINNWFFAGFWSDKTNSYYKQPKWIDKRSDYQKFIDEYGLILQLTAVAATIVAGLISGGAAWVITLEIVLELGVGIPVAIREVQKGENIAAAFSFLTAIVPLGKLSKTLRGVSQSEFDSLSQQLLRSNLTRNSSEAEFETWMKSLPKRDQKTLRKLLTTDEKSKKEFLDEVAKYAQDQSKIFDELSETLKNNPNSLKDLKFFEKLWARELTANGLLFIISLSLKLCCEKELDSDEKEKLRGFYYVIPDELKKEVAFNIFQNSPESKKLMPVIGNVKNLIDSANIVNNAKKCEWINTELKNEFSKNGLPYTELSDNTTKSKNKEKISDEIVKDLRSKGWVPKNELGDQEFYDFKFIEDGWYLVKPI